MKKLITIIMLLISSAVHGQNKVVTFLDIPVKGNTEKFIKKLVKKGFQNFSANRLEGVFENSSCYIDLISNKGKVCGIIITEKTGTMSVDSVISRYNKLIEKYNDDIRYIEIEHNRPVLTTGDNEGIICVDSHQYHAEYFQKNTPQDYRQRMSFGISNIDGYYYIVFRFETINDYDSIDL